MHIYLMHRRASFRFRSITYYPKSSKVDWFSRLMSRKSITQVGGSHKDDAPRADIRAHGSTNRRKGQKRIIRIGEPTFSWCWWCGVPRVRATNPIGLADREANRCRCSIMNAIASSLLPHLWTNYTQNLWDIIIRVVLPYSPRCRIMRNMPLLRDNPPMSKRLWYF